MESEEVKGKESLIWKSFVNRVELSKALNYILRNYESFGDKGYW